MRERFTGEVGMDAIPGSVEEVIFANKHSKLATGRYADHTRLIHLVGGVEDTRAAVTGQMVDSAKKFPKIIREHPYIATTTIAVFAVGVGGLLYSQSRE